MKKRITGFVVCLLFSSILFAQDTVAAHQDLHAVDIVRPAKLRYMQTGARIDVLDSTITRLYAAGTLTDLLGGSGAMNVKNNGAGGLTTMAIRGANSMQTPIVWNGINLQNINNNTVDLSLIPVFLFDQVAVQPGGASAKWGSGAVGGVIMLSSTAGEKGIGNTWLYGSYHKHRVVYEMGSFGFNSIGVQYAGGIGKWQYDIKAYRQRCKNNFSFNNIGVVGQVKDTLEHAEVEQQGVISDVSYNLHEKHTIRVSSWVQETNRELAPTMLQNGNESTQQDYALRLVGRWIYLTRTNTNLVTTAAVIHEGLVYDPGYSSPVNNTNAWTSMLGSEITHFSNSHQNKIFNKITTTSGVNFIYSGSEVTGYIVYKSQYRLSAYTGFSKYLREQDEFNISVRGEMVNGKLVQPVGSIWYSLWAKEWLGVKGCVSKSYRIPTFNDLYWAPGGNPNLLPESAWTEELTVVVRKQWKQNIFEYSLTGYNRNVIDMIAWVPSASYWMPMNINEVWSRGMEHRLKTKLSYFNWNFTLNVNLDYVRSTSEKTGVANDVAIRKQLIYVPAWFGGANVTVQKKHIYFTYAYLYTDLRFTSRDHVEWLPAFSISNVALGYTPTKSRSSGNYAFNFYAKCNNIFDVQYQSVAWRPMPGVNFQIGCTIDFANQNTLKQ